MPITSEQAQAELRRRAASAELERRGQFAGGQGGEFRGTGITGAWEPPRTLREKIAHTTLIDVLAHVPFSPWHEYKKTGAFMAKRQLKTKDYGPRIRYGMTPMGGYTAMRLPTTRKQLKNIIAEQEIESQREETIPAAIAGGVADLPGYMGEFAALGGGIPTTITRGLMGAAKMTAGQPHRMASAVMDQIERGEKGVTAVAKGWGDIYIENLSEMAGAGFPAVARKMPFGGRIIDGLHDFHKKMGMGDSTFWKKISTKAGYNGLLAEWGEERLGTYLRGLTNVQDFGAGKDASTDERIAAGFAQDFQARNMLIEAGVLLAPFAAKQISKVAFGKREASTEEAPSGIPPGSNVYRGKETGKIVVETPEDIGAGTGTIEQKGRVYEKTDEGRIGEELIAAPELGISAIQDTPTEQPLNIPPAEEVIQALTPEGEDKPRVRLRAEPRSKKELLWRGHTLPEAFGLDEESRRDLMEESVGKRSMKEMTPEEQELFVAHLEGLAKQSGIEIEIPVIDRAVKRLQEISKKKEKLTPTEELHQSNISKMVTGVKSWASEAYHSLQRPERFIESLDGEEDGVLRENVWKPVKTADEIAVLNTAAGIEEYTRLLDENTIDPSLLLGKVEKVGPGIKLTRDEQIGVYLLSQNENGKRYLNKGMKISDVAITDIVDNLSQTEKMLGDWMAERYESQWPTIVAAAEQAGIDSEELIKELNYAPVIRSDIDPLDQVDFTDILIEGFTKESFKPEQGFLEQRKKRAIGKIELSASMMYLNNVRRTERFKAMAPVAKKVGVIFRNQEFKDSLNDATYGHGSKLLNTWLRDTIKGYSPTEQDLFAKSMRVLRRNSIVYAIGYNIPSSMRQALSLSNAMAVSPLMLKYVPINLIKATKNFSKLKGEVHSKSSLVPSRDYERDLRQKWTKSVLSKKLKGKDPFDKKATAWIKWMDQHTVVVAWKSLYDTSIQQGKNEEAAIEYADKWVGRTQPMANAKDLPQFFRGGTLAKIISTFQNQINNNWNFYTHDILGARVKEKISNTETAYRVMFSYILPAIAFGVIGRGGLPKSWKQLTVDLVTYPIAAIMLLGRIINKTILGWGNSTSIIEAAPEEATKALKAFARGDIGKAINSSAKTIGALTGKVPTAQMSRTFTGAIDLATGDTKDPRRLIWSQWALDQGKKPTETPARRRIPAPPRRRRSE